MTKAESPAGMCLRVIATTPERTVLLSSYPNNRETCVLDPSQPGAHCFIPQGSISSFKKVNKYLSNHRQKSASVFNPPCLFNAQMSIFSYLTKYCKLCSKEKASDTNN